MRVSEMIFYCFICIVSLILPVLAEDYNGLQNLNIYTVDKSASDTGYDSNMVMDNQGFLHISYYDATNGDLKYARQIKGDFGFDNKVMNATKYDDWVVFTVDAVGTVGRFSSIKLNSLGRPSISYYDAKNKALKYARFDGQKFIIQYVDTGNVGMYSSLALDRSDRPYISYYEANRRTLKCAVNDGFRWNVEEVDKENQGDLGLYTSLAMGADGYARISYYDNRNGKLKFARNKGKEWEVEDVDAADNSKFGVFSNLILGYNDIPHIAYYDTTNNNLRYAVKKGFSWDKQVVDNNKNVGQYASIKLDISGVPWIIYYDAGSRKLKLSQYSGTKWRTTFPLLTATDIGMYCSLVIDKNNKWHISSIDSKSRKLVYSNNVLIDQRPPNQWRWESITVR